jgi:hypothetical protein
MHNDQIIIYQGTDGSATVEVKLREDTLWLTLNQLAELFESDKSVISRHLRNIFLEGELDRNATVAKNATVQNEGNRNVVRDVEYYNLDAILSLGYRVNSKRGTQFRIWANQVLKDYLIKGYTLNERKLKEQSEQFNSLKQAVNLLGNVLKNKELTNLINANN